MATAEFETSPVNQTTNKEKKIINRSNSSNNQRRKPNEAKTGPPIQKHSTNDSEPQN
jgi:hypothetical protein